MTKSASQSASPSASPFGVAMPPRDRSQLMSRFAPFLLIAGIFLLAAWIVIGEWRDGSIGAYRVVDVRSVVFDAKADGTLTVHLTDTVGAVTSAHLPSSSEGFVATIAKSLARDRRRFDVAETLPFRLTRSEIGTLMLKDPVIGTEIRLEAFGPTNAAAFAALMSTKRANP